MTFGYEALTAAGKTVKGSIEAETLEAAKNQVRQQGLTVVSIGEQSIMNKDLNIEIGGKPKAKDMSLFCRQFVSMTKAGVSILEALKLLTEQTENVKLKKATAEVRASVEKGMTLSDAMAEHPKIFSDLMVNLVAAGESSGSLDNALTRLAVQFERTTKTNGLIKKAMIYPIIIVCLTIAIVVVMLIVIVPRYVTMFGELGTDLPKITMSVVNGSKFLQGYWMIYGPILIGVIVGIKMFSATSTGKHVFHKIVIKLPISKDLIIKQSSSMMARTLSTLMAAGVPLVEAVDITASTMTNVYFKEALEMCRDGILIGQPLSRPLQDCGLFPPMVYHMTRIGEESGSTEEMLTKLADYYDEEVEEAVGAFTAALEPLMIIVMAGVVGYIVTALMAPMLSMYNALNGM